MTDVLICTDWVASTAQCNAIDVVEDVYLMPASAEGAVDLILNGGFSPEAYTLAFTGISLLWVVGLGVGLTVSQVRKVKSV